MAMISRSDLGAGRRIPRINRGIGLEKVSLSVRQERSRAEIRPAVTDIPNPKGFPTAMANCPTLTLSEPPNLRAENFSPFSA